MHKSKMHKKGEYKLLSERVKVPAAMLQIHIHSDTIYRTTALLCLHLGRNLDLSLLPVRVGQAVSPPDALL